MRMIKLVIISCFISLFIISTPYGQWVRVMEFYGNVLSFWAYSHTPGTMDLMAGTNSGGIFFSGDYGTNWSPTSLTNTSVMCLASDEIGSNIFAGTYGQGISRSDDYGVNWATYNNGLTTHEDSIVKAIAISPNGLGGINVFAGTDGGFFMSPSYGTNWIYKDLSHITAIAISEYGVGGASIYAAAYANGIYLSKDEGTTWTDISSNLPYRNMLVLVLGKIESVDTTLFTANGQNYLYRSTNNGANWTLIDYNNGLTNGGVLAMAILPENPDIVFAGTSGGGVFLSIDNGTSWISVNYGLTNTVIRSLIITDNGSGGKYLFAGTGNGGIWRRNLSEMVVSIRDLPGKFPAVFSLDQNYPNPFNPATTISYQLPAQCLVALKVYDAVGREVATLLNRVEKPGYKSVQFDASRLSSGIYYYRLQAGNYLETRKLLLVR